MNPKRKILQEYTAAARDIELTEAAIELLEKVSGRTAKSCIARLKRSQQTNLKRLDANAAKLGAPYGS